MPPSLPSWKLALGVPFITITSVIGLLWVSQSKIIYPARDYSKYGLRTYYDQQQHAFLQQGHELHELEYINGHGERLKSYYVEAKKQQHTSNKKDKMYMWVLIGGNGMLALDWLSFVHRVRTAMPAKFERDVFILMEFPGYGVNSNSDIRGPGEDTMIPHVGHVLVEAKRYLQRSDDDDNNIEINLVAHSLGCAVGLAAANEGGVTFHRLVLVSPFASIAAMATSIFVSSILPSNSTNAWMESLIAQNNRWDNLARIVQLAKKPNSPKQMFVIHGTRDDIVPFTQGVQLYETMIKVFPQARFIAIDNGDHNSIFTTGFDEIVEAMIGRGGGKL